jgi:hypothetical protein
MKRILLTLLFILLPIVVSAQSRTLEYTYDTTPAEVATYTQQVFLDNVLLTGVPTCTLLGSTQTQCKFTLGTLTPGTHVIKVVATLGQQSAEGSMNYDPSKNPKNPINIKIVITITVP